MSHERNRGMARKTKTASRVNDTIGATPPLGECGVKKLKMQLAEAPGAGANIQRRRRRRHLGWRRRRADRAQTPAPCARRITNGQRR